MKLLLSYFLVTLYAVIMMKPIMPQLADSFAHVLNYSDHIRIVHQEYGVSHVHYEYASQEKKKSPADAGSDGVKTFNMATEHLIGIVIINHLPAFDAQDFSLGMSPNLRDQFSETPLHPPRC